MQKFWSILAVRLGKHAGLVGLCGLLITVGLSFGIPQLKFATGQESYLNESDQIAIDNKEYQSNFGGQAMLTVITMDEGHKVEELFTDENLAQFRAFSERVKREGQVLGVISGATAMEFSDNVLQSPDGNPTSSVAGKALLAAQNADPTEEGKKLRGEDALKSLTRINAVDAGARKLGQPEWNKVLLYDNEGAVRKALTTFIPDDRHAMVISRLVGNLDIVAEGEAAGIVQNAAKDFKFAHTQITTTGAPVLLKELNDYLRGGMLTLGGIAVAIMVLILLVLFDVRWRLLPLAVIVLGVTWAFGLAGFLGIPLTIVTIAGLPVMLGVGIDYAIQMHARIEEEVIIDRSEHPIQETARNLGPALLVVTFDAIFAFLALHFAKVPMIRDFGLLLIVGIAAICLCSIFMPLAALGVREFRSPTKGRDFSEGALGRLVVRLGSLPAKAAIPLAVGSLLIFVGGIFAEDELKLQTDPVKWINQSSETIKDVRTIEREVNASSELGVNVRDDSGVFNDRLIKFVHGFTVNTLKTNRGIPGKTDMLVQGSSIETTVGDLLYLRGAGDVAPRAEDVKGAFDVAPKDVQVSLVSPDGKSFNISFLTGPGSLDDRAGLVREMRENSGAPDRIELTPSGLAVVGVGLVDNLESNRILLTYLSIAFVFIFLAFRLRSVVRSLLSLVPVLIAVGAASLVAYVAGFELSPMTAVGGPLIIAACTEFTSLILLRFVEERQRGYSPKEAVDITAARTGRAFIVSGLTAISGVAVLASSSFPLLRDFGLIVAINVAVALLSALIVLPPMLVWADERNWVSRGLVKRSDTDYIPTPPMGSADANS